MPKLALNAQFVNSITCPPGKSKENYYDVAVTGFILEVRASGGKTYALRYKDQHGRQIQHKIGDAQSISFDKAKNAAKVLRSKVVLGEDPSAEKRIKKMVPTLDAFVRDSYVPFIMTDKRSWQSDLTLLDNHILPRFGALHLDKITEQAINDFKHSMVSKGYKMGYANRSLVLIKYLFNLALKWDTPGVTTNPAKDVKLFQANNERTRFLTAEETQLLLAELDKSRNKQIRFVVPLLLLLGCRKRELLDSKWEDIDLDRRTWRIPMSKSGKARHVPLSKVAIEILNQLPQWEGCPYVVPNPDTKLPFVMIQRAWDNARKAAGLPEVRMHDLRHSMASNMVNSGRSIYEVAKVLGHSQLKTSMRYSHLSQETLLAAVDAAATATGMGQI
ncbi:site-specific integrase [uncultured Desulfobulbus sp.]|uniref:site-specific integrase n=1 Tax=uncultured Desulfobulbus sp. TaxID=239745 RepID=UPI0029C867E2|nr:site-specific integrase [uncultured Desulfobulbus sp.]